MKRWKIIRELSTGRMSIYNSKVCKIYTKNETVTPGLLGVFVFDTKRNAVKSLNFLSAIYSYSSRHKIIEVEAIGRGKRLNCCPSIISYDGTRIETLVEEFKDRSINSKYTNPHNYDSGTSIRIDNFIAWVCPTGTMVYPSVKVLN